MKPRKISEKVSFLGAQDFDRRLFDELLPLPNGTSYNAYLVEGSEKTALIDTVDPKKSEILLDQLAGAGRIDYLVSQHTEQDHSGTIPQVLALYPDAKVLASPKARPMLVDHLHIDPERIRTSTGRRRSSPTSPRSGSYSRVISSDRTWRQRKSTLTIRFAYTTRRSATTPRS